MFVFIFFRLNSSLSLSSLQSSLSLAHLPRLFSAAISCLLSPHTQVVSAATNTLKVKDYALDFIVSGIDTFLFKST